jgi:hypothetical protein
VTQIYVWRPSTPDLTEAQKRFEHQLERQTAFYDKYLSTRCSFRSLLVGRTFIAQISSDLGIEGWQPWWEHDGLGVAWGGVCEDYLGPPAGRPRFRELVAAVIDWPGRLVDLGGSFSVCAWDSARGIVGVATAATQHQTLWMVQGPEGTAIGSRGRPLLDLVGRSVELDEEGASVFLAYNYLHDDAALFKGVTRITARRHLQFGEDSSPRIRVYECLAGYLGEPAARDFDEAVDASAEALIGRVARELVVSTDPILYLSGGRDSRCIAAALRQADFGGPALTGGPRRSPDVRVATRVAKRLAFHHIVDERPANDADHAERIATARERARLRVALGEGAESIAFGVLDRAFFTSDARFPARSTPGFVGLHAGLQKPRNDSYAPAKLNRFVGPHLKHGQAVMHRFEALRTELALKLDALQAPASRWPDLYYWQYRALRWGQDQMLAKDLFAWWWTPLFDRTIIRSGWHLPSSHASRRFVESLADRVAPELVGLPYAGDTNRSRRFPIKLQRGIWRRASSLARLVRSSSSRPARNERFWQSLLFDGSDPSWKELIDESYVREAIRRPRVPRIVWSVATVQLFIETEILGIHN